MKILITGAAGYLGQLLVKSLNQNKNIDNIFALDKKPKPESLILNSKIQYFKLDLAKNKWEEKIPEIPNVIVHLAFDIRTKYGQNKKQELNNIFGTKQVLKYCIDKKIKKLIYFSSVAAYGAKPENIGRFLTENDPLTETIYPYAAQKKETEEIIEKYKNLGSQIIIIRSGSITGQEGGKRKNLGLLKFIKNIAPVLPIINPGWARQYLHENDAIEAIKFLIFNNVEKQFEIFNLAPSDLITMADMAKLLHKKTIKIPAVLIKPIFALSWHLTFGLIPTPPGSDKSFIYPINVDGSKINKIGFNYKYSIVKTFLGENDK